MSWWPPSKKCSKCASAVAGFFPVRLSGDGCFHRWFVELPKMKAFASLHIQHQKTDAFHCLPGPGSLGHWHFEKQPSKQILDSSGTHAADVVKP